MMVLCKEDIVKQKNVTAISGRRERFTVGTAIIYLVLAAITLVSFLPFWHIIACTFADANEVANSKFLLFPTNFSFDAIKYVFSSKSIIQSMMNSFWITIVGTAFSLMMTALMAYPLSRPNLHFRNQIMFVIVLTMVFHPGLIPNFLNVKSLGLYNNSWALILPGLIGPYNLILIKNYYQSLPGEMLESATIDGASDWSILTKIIVPLSKPIFATVGLFYAVGYWNSYLNAVIFLDDQTKWPIQVLLRNIVLMAQTDLGSEAGSVYDMAINLKSLRSATILIATVPILCVYPLVQKHFVKGVMLGSVKG